MSPSMKGTQKMIENVYIWHKQSTHIYIIYGLFTGIFIRCQQKSLKNQEKKMFLYLNVTTCNTNTMYIKNLYNNVKNVLKGTVSRDFRPFVFFQSNNSVWIPDMYTS
jgi:hypothetical protein